MLTLIAAGTALMSTHITDPIQSGTDTRMTWWREARFGMFIHWGLYSILAGEWKGSKGHAEWIRDTARIPVDEYEKLLSEFNPVKFDAKEWVRMAEDAGMKYIVITSKHHDGFCLFDSQYTDWDVMSTPFKRDILKELSDACKASGVRFSTYHSIMDWHHPDYLPRRPWEVATRPAEGANFDRFVEYLRNQVTEILTKYDPGVMWFDGEWESTWTHEYGGPLYELCRKVKPDVIVNNRVDKGRGGMAGMTEGEHAGDFGTPEQEIPATGIPGVDWESCITMNRNWGFNAEDKNFKSTTELLRMLCDIVSKGGNFLLNIGPKADGTFPQESIDRLREIGQWMKVNGESIHGTNAGPFEPFGWGRCTQKRDGNDTFLYFHVFEWPSEGPLMLPRFGNEVDKVEVLGVSSDLTVIFGPNSVGVSLPSAQRDPHATVLKVRIKGKPIVFEKPAVIAPALKFVNMLDVQLRVASPGLKIRYTMDGTLPTNRSREYIGPIRLRATTLLRAASFYNDELVSDNISVRFEKVAPWPATTVPTTAAGLARKKYAGNWDKLPNFAELTPVATDAVGTVTLPPPPTEEYVAYVFEGFLRVDSTDAYVFDLRSDDGSRLEIDGTVVVDNDGLHSSAAKRGVAPLDKGLHRIRVLWFNKTGGADLELRMGQIGRPLELIPGELLYRGG